MKKKNAYDIHKRFLWFKDLEDYFLITFTELLSVSEFTLKI